jgi:AcrR family transcriptional regulator
MEPTEVSKSGRGRPALTALELAQKREAIANAARTLFAAEGFAAVSMRNVAEAAGMTPMTLYRYFDTKVDLLRFLWSDVLNALFDSLEAIEKRERNHTKRLERVSIAYVRYWVDHPDHYRMVFMSEGISQPAVSVFVQEDDVVLRYSLFVRCVAEAVGRDAGEVSVESELLISSLQGIAHNLVTIHGHAWHEPEVLVRRFVGLLTGLRRETNPG